MNEYQSLLHSLSLNNKGRLIWTASYDSLQRFVEEYLNLRERSWSSPGGDGKLYEAGDVSIKWYANSQTITVYGENKAEVEEKLKSAASVSKDLWSIKSWLSRLSLIFDNVYLAYSFGLEARERFLIFSREKLGLMNPWIWRENQQGVLISFSYSEIRSLNLKYTKMPKIKCYFSPEYLFFPVIFCFAAL